jgi:hypothetical protein
MLVEQDGGKMHVEFFVARFDRQRGA